MRETPRSKTCAPLTQIRRSGCGGPDSTKTNLLLADPIPEFSTTTTQRVAPEEREYQITGVIGDDEVGQPSAIVSAVVPG
ncbi:MAG: hypothetical protein H0X34_04575 [Chthoniobacterales bacterium]|nr:hypothetical protein [Chthoniobacterales bacterium]